MSETVQLMVVAPCHSDTIGPLTTALDRVAIACVLITPPAWQPGTPISDDAGLTDPASLDEKVCRSLVDLIQSRETAALVANPWMQPEHGFAQGFEPYVRASDDRIWQGAIELMRTADRPFFLYLHSFIVHGPYQAATHDVDALRSAPGAGATQPLTETQWKQIPGYLRKPEWAHQDDARDIR